jgi:purine-binding chemotaxis protein CheW
MTAMTAHADQSLSFRIAGRDYALPLLQTREILPLPPLTLVPTTPPYVLGVFNLVGRVVPVLDVALKLGLGATAHDDKSYVVVSDVPLAGETAVVGILVEALGDVVNNDAVERLELGDVVESR